MMPAGNKTFMQPVGDRAAFQAVVGVAIICSLRQHVLHPCVAVTSSNTRLFVYVETKSCIQGDMVLPHATRHTLRQIVQLSPIAAEAALPWAYANGLIKQLIPAIVTPSHFEISRSGLIEPRPCT